MLRLALLALVVISATSCAYPRRTTSLTPVRGDYDTGDVPADLWQFTVVSASIPPRQRSGLAWDDDSGNAARPDAFVRIYRGDELVWESPVRDDQTAPRWNQSLEKNLWVPRDRELRLELWDRDSALSSDPIGIYRNQGLPSGAAPDVDASILLEGGATLIIRVARPRPHHGVGIREFEVRGDSIHVGDVIDRSPASRAGIRNGDSIIAIGGVAVDDMDEARAVTSLSQAGRRGARLTIERDGAAQSVELDRGYTWLAM
jgi:hypothetical protein